MVKQLVAALAFLSALVGQQPGQHELGQRLWQAAAQQDYQAGLRKAASGHSVPQIVDALIQRERPITDHLGRRIVSTLLDSAALGELWRQEPGKRRARAPVFARSGMQWVRRWVEAGPAERADIEHVAQHAVPSDQRVSRSLHDRNVEVAKAARTLRRLAVRAEMARQQPGLARIVATPAGTAPEAPDTYPTAIAYDVFALARFVEDERRHVQAAALVLLREKLHLGVPRSVREALREHPNVHLRWQQPPVPTPASGERGHRWRIDAVDAGEDPDRLLPPSYVAQQSGKVRKEIGMALLRAALRVPLVGEASTRNWQLGAGLLRAAFASPEDGRATVLLTRAARTHDDVSQLIVALARPGRDVRLRMRALLSGVWVASPASAGVIEDLIADPDPRIAMGAAQVAATWFRHEQDQSIELAGLRQAVFERALAALKAGAVIMARHEMMRGWCGTMDGPLPLVVSDASSLVVWIAARLGDARLLDPLLARVAAGAASEERKLVLACLARLAPFADKQQAERLWKLLSPALPADEELAIVSGLAGVLSAQRRDALLQFAVDGFGRQVCAGVAAAGKRVPESIAEAFVLKLGIENQKVRPLLHRCPKLLQSAWAEGGESRQGVLRALRRAVVHWPMWQAVFRGWPDDMVVEVVRWSYDLPLPPLELVARLGRLPANELLLVRWLSARPVGEDASHLPHLEQLAQHANWQVAHAAAWRAHALGEAGQELFRGTLKRLLVAEDLIVVQSVLSFMLHKEVAAPGWEAAANRLRKHPGRAAIADQASAMFGKVAIESVAPASRASVLGNSGAAVELAELKRLVGEQDVSPALRSRSATTVASTLQILAERSPWSESLHKLVVAKLDDGDARVRRAAYAALATRDREVFAHAWLVYEAGFDPDESVRAVVTRVKRLTR